MKKLLTVVGARPQFIKAGILSKHMVGLFYEVMVHTGQHYDDNMSEVFFRELGIPNPQYNLNIGSHSHAAQTAKMMIGIEEIIINERPDGVLIYGDTNSTIAASLAASKLLVPVFHVEGGIRTHCMDMPEEQNRIVTDHLSSMIFISTEDNYREAESEGLGKRSFVVGDIMYDSLIHYREIAEQQGNQHHFKQLQPLFEKREINQDFYLATFHRPENTDNADRFENIIEALNLLEHQVILAVHPRIKKRILENRKEYSNIYFVEPLPYFTAIFLAGKAIKVITDSGGLHKEAYLLGTPCVTVLRSGWMETTTGGWNHFVKPEKSDIISAVNNNEIDLTHLRNEFGDGTACIQITDLLNRFFASDEMRIY